MKSELENKLYKIDPVFFEQAINCRNGIEDAFRCECGDGWFEPLCAFAEKVRVLNDCLKQYGAKIVCEQLKEKFGELTVYHCMVFDWVKSADWRYEIKRIYDIFEDVLESTRKECWSVCEICGVHDDYRGGNLITTKGRIRRICKDCAYNKKYMWEHKCGGQND